MVKPTKQIIRPYGDRRDDGVVQLSFTFPVPLSEKAKEAAAQFVRKMGFSDVKVAAAERAADNYTFFIVYARSGMYIDYAEIDVPEVIVKKMGFDDLNALIKEKVGRRVVVFGACTGTDTHTVGIDAILNMKGYAGDYGLERYPWFEAHNLGSQVPNEDLIKRAMARNADAILVSQVVTQRDAHLANTREMSAAFNESYPAGRRPLLVVGGPRFDEAMAGVLGVDRVFAKGTTPADVASYLVHALAVRRGVDPTVPAPPAELLQEEMA